METLLVVACSLISFQDDPVSDYKKLSAEIRRKKSESVELVRQSHIALDQAKYDLSVRLHKKAQALQREIAELTTRQAQRQERAVAAAIRDMDSDDIDVRDRADRLLRTFGPKINPLLEAALKSASLETRARLKRIIVYLRDFFDGEGFLRQWAADANASSQYSPTGWSAKQATGKPNTFRNGDIRTAWASAASSGGKEWIVLTYRRSVRPKFIRIHETYNPGAVVKIEAMDQRGKWRVFWQGKDKTKVSPGWLHARYSGKPFSTRQIRITLNTRIVPGWNEIDAVELVGEPLR